MDTGHNGCGCGCNGGTACLDLPPEFVKVRYYYGQRLGVMELNDASAYHAGKHAFHNAHLHGVGVVCGLRAERYVTQGAPLTTVLRVRRGVAIDACGREILVGVDQCIDVGAWFARNRTRPEIAAWAANSTQQLTVAVRYRECPSDPAPAPRDPCGCDDSGCEYGRIREGFELALLTAKEVQCVVGVFPAANLLRGALAGGGPVDRISAAIAGLVAADCPDPAKDGWLCLATVDVLLDGTPAPVDLPAINNTPPGRATLLATSALQQILIGVAAAAADSGMALSGPVVTGLQFANGANPGDGTITLNIQLFASGTPVVTTALAPATFQAGFVRLHRLTAGAWVDVAPTIALTAANTITVDMVGSLTLNDPHRLTVDQSFITPVSDVDGRPLSPLRMARHFAFVPDAAGVPQLVPSS